MTLKEFKTEYRNISTDVWGDAMDAWFEVAGHMYQRDLNIPNEWNYKTGLGNPTETDCYWYEIFKECTNNELEIIGNFLFRYCQFLVQIGVNY